MSFWDILGIDPTNDTSAVKKAYAKELRKHHPEDDPEGFQTLHEAYSAALKYIKYIKEKPSEAEINTITSDNYFEKVDLEDEQDESPNKSSNDAEPRHSFNIVDIKNSSEDIENSYEACVNNFISNIKNIYDKFETRINIENWIDSFNSEAIWYMGNKEYLNSKVIEFLMTRHYFPQNIWNLFEKIFEFSKNYGYYCERYGEKTINYVFSFMNLPIELSYEHLKNIDGIDIDEYFKYRYDVYSAFVQGNLKDAEENFKKAFSLYKDDPCLLRMYGEYYLYLQDIDNALSTFNHSLNIFSDDNDVIFEKAKILYQKNDVSKCLECCKKLHDDIPDNTDISSLLGKCYFKLNDIENAKNIFLEIIKKNPLDIDAKVFLSKIAYKLEQKSANAADKAELKELYKSSGILKNNNKGLKVSAKAALILGLILFLFSLKMLSIMMGEANVKFSIENISDFFDGKRHPVVINNYKDLDKLAYGKNTVKINFSRIQFLDLCKIDKKDSSGKITTLLVSTDYMIDNGLDKYLNVDDAPYVCVGKLGKVNLIVMTDPNQVPDADPTPPLKFIGTVYKNKSTDLKSKAASAYKGSDKLITNIYLGKTAKLENPPNYQMNLFGIPLILSFFFFISAIFKQIRIM